MNQVGQAADEDQANSDEDISDEELDVSNDSLLQALKTRVGGSERKSKNNTPDMDTHHQHSDKGMRLAKHI